MRQAKKHYREILLIEMDDLKEDLDCMIQRTEEAFRQGRITERVHKENAALFRNEKLGVDEFSKLLHGLDVEGHASLDAMIEALKLSFRSLSQRLALANAVVICVERKLDKVRRYVIQ